MGRFSWFGVSDALALFKRRGEAARDDARDLFFQVKEHAAALAQLLALELQGYLRVQGMRALLCLVAALMLLVAYVALWVFVAVLLATCVGWLWAAGICCVANVLLAGLLLLVAGRMKPGALAPDTVKEIKNDLQCLSLLIQNSPKKPGS